MQKTQNCPDRKGLFLILSTQKPIIQNIHIDQYVFLHLNKILLFQTTSKMYQRVLEYKWHQQRKGFPNFLSIENELAGDLFGTWRNFCKSCFSCFPPILPFYFLFYGSVFPNILENPAESSRIPEEIFLNNILMIYRQTIHV